MEQFATIGATPHNENIPTSNKTSPWLDCIRGKLLSMCVQTKLIGLIAPKDTAASGIRCIQWNHLRLHLDERIVHDWFAASISNRPLQFDASHSTYPILSFKCIWIILWIFMLSTSEGETHQFDGKASSLHQTVWHIYPVKMQRKIVSIYPECRSFNTLEIPNAVCEWFSFSQRHSMEYFCKKLSISSFWKQLCRFLWRWRLGHKHKRLAKGVKVRERKCFNKKKHVAIAIA